jgi:hypothetical protein
MSTVPRYFVQCSHFMAASIAACLIPIATEQVPQVLLRCCGHNLCLTSEATHLTATKRKYAERGVWFCDVTRIMTTSGPVRAPTPHVKSARNLRTSSESMAAARPQNPSVPAPTKSHAPRADTTTTTAAVQDTSAPAASGQAAARRGPRSATQDPLSDKATIFLVRRILCPQNFNDKGKTRSGSPVSIEDLLPPLTSRNDVDLQLYAFIAIIIRDYVQTWYGRITPDETFVGEIVQIIAHCTRALEQRLRELDLETLLLDELPGLLDKHIRGACSQPFKLGLGRRRLAFSVSESSVCRSLLGLWISDVHIPFRYSTPLTQSSTPHCSEGRERGNKLGLEYDHQP